MQYYDGKRVLVTGAAGFIPSHVVDALLKAGATVVGVDNFLTGRIENLRQAQKNSSFTFIEADVVQSPLSYLPKDSHFDTVFHLASPASPPRYAKYPVETYLVNSMGTHNLLQYILGNGVDTRFVFSSTSEIYGDPETHPQPESYWGNVNPNGPRSCYDESKRLGETICGVHSRNLGLDVRIARIFNTYGPRMDPEDGRAIPDFFSKALQGMPLRIHGSGSQTRSFCFSSDLVDGLLKLGSVEGIDGETINLGNPTERTILEIAEEILKLTSSKSQIEHVDRPVDDPEKRKPTIQKAEKLLGWTPVTDLATGLKLTQDYFSSLY